jgi:AcrR family transcriptional regulator
MRRALSDEEKGERRSEILAAAKKVFARRGYHATTIADIAKAAKLSYGSIYWYFESKDALFHALMAHEVETLRAHIAHALTTTSARGTPDAQLRATVSTTFECFESDRALVKLLFRDSHALGDQFDKYLFDIYEAFITDIETIVLDAQRRGVLVEAPARMMAYSVAAVVGQIAQRRLVTDDGLSTDEVADFAVALLLNGLLAR